MLCGEIKIHINTGLILFLVLTDMGFNFYMNTALSYIFRDVLSDNNNVFFFFHFQSITNLLYIT